jgi:chromosome segregation ATPase
MKPAPPETADLLHRVRQQLVLAQVRIMELEDHRDELAPRLNETEALLAAAQALADQKLDESAHLAKVGADLQRQCDHLRHMQHVTHEALTAARQEHAAVSARLAVAEQHGTQLRQDLTALAEQAGRLNQTISRLGLELASATSLAATHLARLNELDAEARTMKASRSWRWTRWLRSLERTFGGGRS